MKHVNDEHMNIIIKETKDTFRMIQVPEIPNQLLTKQLFKKVTLIMRRSCMSLEDEESSFMNISASLYQIYTTQDGNIKSAEKKLKKFLITLMSNSKNRRIRLFLRFIGCIDRIEIDPLLEKVYLSALSKLVLTDSLGSSIKTDFENGCQMIPLIRAIDFANQFMKPKLTIGNYSQFLKEIKDQAIQDEEFISNNEGVIDFDQFMEKLFMYTKLNQDSMSQFWTKIYTSMILPESKEIKFDWFLLFYKRIEHRATTLPSRATAHVWNNFCYYGRNSNSKKIISTEKISLQGFIMMCSDLSLFKLSSIYQYLDISEEDVDKEFSICSESYVTSFKNFKNRVKQLKQMSDKEKDSFSSYVEASLQLDELGLDSYDKLCTLIKLNISDWFLRYKEIQEDISFSQVLESHS